MPAHRLGSWLVEQARQQGLGGHGVHAGLLTFSGVSHVIGMPLQHDFSLFPLPLVSRTRELADKLPAPPFETSLRHYKVSVSMFQG